MSSTTSEFRWHAVVAGRPARPGVPGAGNPASGTSRAHARRLLPAPVHWCSTSAGLHRHRHPRRLRREVRVRRGRARPDRPARSASAVARALVLADELHRAKLRANGLLTRDPRAGAKKPGRPGRRKRFPVQQAVDAGHLTTPRIPPQGAPRGVRRAGRRWRTQPDGKERSTAMNSMHPRCRTCSRPASISGHADARGGTRRAAVHLRGALGIYIIDLQKTLRQIASAGAAPDRGPGGRGDGVSSSAPRSSSSLVQAEAREGRRLSTSPSGAGRDPDQLQTHQEADPPAARPRAGTGRRGIRELHQEGAAAVQRDGRSCRDPRGPQADDRLPGALFVRTAKKEKIAIQEANKLGIPVVAIVDTQPDPDVITRPIPGKRRTRSGQWR